MLLEVPHTMESASKELYRTQFTNKANELFKDLKEKGKLNVQTDATIKEIVRVLQEWDSIEKKTAIQYKWKRM